VSTRARVESSVPDQPATFRTVFAHQGPLFAAFSELYGTFWSHGRLDHVTKETARLRNARITDCGY
jgi:hypothetical protein